MQGVLHLEEKFTKTITLMCRIFSRDSPHMKSDESLLTFFTHMEILWDKLFRHALNCTSYNLN